MNSWLIVTCRRAGQVWQYSKGFPDDETADREAQRLLAETCAVSIRGAYGPEKRHSTKAR